MTILIMFFTVIALFGRRRSLALPRHGAAAFARTCCSNAAAIAYAFRIDWATWLRLAGRRSGGGLFWDDREGSKRSTGQRGHELSQAVDSSADSHANIPAYQAGTFDEKNLRQAGADKAPETLGRNGTDDQFERLPGARVTLKATWPREF